MGAGGREAAVKGTGGRDPLEMEVKEMEVVKELAS